MGEHADQLSFKGKVQVMRDNVAGDMQGGHAWVTLLSDQGLICCIDTLNNLLADIGIDTQSQIFLPKDKIIQKFGADVIQRQIKKAEILKGTFISN